MAGEQGQVSPGTPQESVNSGGSTLDAAVAAELELLEQGDGGSKGSQDDNPNDQADDGDEAPDDKDEQGDDDEADGTDPDDDDLPAAEAVEYELENGKKVKVDPDLVPYLMKDADYRQKTAQVAEYGRHLQGKEQEVEQLFNAGQHFVQARAAVESIDQTRGQIYQQLASDPMMYENDFVRFGQLTGRLQILEKQREGVIGKASQAQEQLDGYQERQRQERIAQARPALASIGLTNEVLAETARYGQAIGAPPEVLKYLSDGNSPVLLLALEKARRFDALMAKQGDVTKQVREAKPIRQVARPGSVSQNTQSGNREKLGKQLKSTGSYSDAVALELAHMARAPSRRSR